MLTLRTRRSFAALLAVASWIAPAAVRADLVVTNAYVVPPLAPYDAPDHSPAVTTTGPDTAWVAFARHGSSSATAHALEILRFDRVMGPVSGSGRDSSLVDVGIGDVAATNDGVAPVIVFVESGMPVGGTRLRARRFDSATPLAATLPVLNPNSTIGFISAMGAPSDPSGWALSYGYAIFEVGGMTTLPQTLVHEVVVPTGWSDVTSSAARAQQAGVSASVVRAGGSTPYAFRTPLGQWRLAAPLSEAAPPSIGLTPFPPALVPVQDGRVMSISSVMMLTPDPPGTLRCAFRAPTGGPVLLPIVCAAAPGQLDEIAAAPDLSRPNSAWVVGALTGHALIWLQLVNGGPGAALALAPPAGTSVDRCRHPRVAAFGPDSVIVAAECASGGGDGAPTRILVWIVSLSGAPPGDGGTDGGLVGDGAILEGGVDDAGATDGGAMDGGGQVTDAAPPGDGGQAGDASAGGDASEAPGADGAPGPLDARNGRGLSFRGGGCACRAAGAPPSRAPSRGALGGALAACAVGVLARRARRSRRR